LYGWKPSAVSIGYFQGLEEEVDLAVAQKEGVSVVRRITGGGAVFHDAELTYSFVTREFEENILDSYRQICGAVLSGLKTIGIEGQFAPLNDLILGGKKFSGNAQTRKNGVLLQHGTILLDVDVDRMFSLLKVPSEKMRDKIVSDVKMRVTGIGTLIHLYSTAYMHDETAPEFARYFSYLNLFASFMLVLVLGASFPVLFIGWEGVGLCSYLLIGFYYAKPSAADAGKKAFVVNRIGDFGFILGMLLLFTTFGTLDFQQLAVKVAEMSAEPAAWAGAGVLTVATLLLFVGATGKSAQIPLYVWLPDAMEGPTPVSALIHAATMVTAGVYMIARNAVLFSHAPFTLEVVAIIGVLAAFGVPRFRESVERSKAGEAFNYLSAVRSAQERYHSRQGQYALDTGSLDISVPAPKYFSLSDITADELNWELTLYRTGASAGYGKYTVRFTERGYATDSNIPITVNPMTN